MKSFLLLSSGILCIIGFTVIRFTSNTKEALFILVVATILAILSLFVKKTRIISCHFDSNTGKFITTVDGIPVDKDSKI